MRYDGCSLWLPLQARVVTRRRWFCRSLLLPVFGCGGREYADDAPEEITVLVCDRRRGIGDLGDGEGLLASGTTEIYQM